MCRFTRNRGCAVGILLIVASPAFVRAQATENALNAAASQPLSAAAAAPACHCVGEESSSTVTKIGAALASPLKATGLDFVETPLEQVVNQLQDQYGISIQLDVLALQDAGLNPQEPVTVSVHNISLKSALRLMLQPHHLTHIVQDEVLKITTPEQAETCLVTCVYDVRDWLSGSSDTDGIQALIDAIISCVASETWAVNGGGQAQIRPLKPGVLVISQTQQVHEDIRDLLAALRQIR
jgi:hypothetical protein